MKRSLRLVGTTLASLAALAAPENDVPAVGPPEHFIIPVPPVVVGLDASPHEFLPHPSYLNRTASSQRKQRQQRSLYHSTTGSFHNLVLLLRFSDHASRPLPSQADISRLYNSEEEGGSYDDIAPTGSVRQVYLQNSYGEFTIQTTVINWITVSHPESYYAAGNHGFSKFKEAIVEALMVLDDDPQQYFQPFGLAANYANFDFGEFDLDDNGALDGLGILHSGYGAEFGGSDCHGALNEERIWSHKGGLDWESSSPPSNVSISSGDVAGGNSSITVNRYYVSSALRGKCESSIVRMGVICHELGHYLGLPDLYDGTFDGTGLGAYDFMSQSWGWDGSGLYPPILSAWSKLEVGWATAQLIEEDGTYSLEASTLSDVVYKITRGYPSGEYLLLENRQPIDYDSKITQGGIAIYHIDENANGQRFRGYPSQSGWPENGEHYKVALLAADGRYDFEKGANQGDEGDLWHAASLLSELRPGEGFPNTDSYQDGNVESTGIRIHGFSSSGNVMTFSVEGLGSMERLDAKDDNAVMQTVVSLTSLFGTPEPTKYPTPQPITLAPTPQPTPKPVTQTPTSQPTSQPTPKLTRFALTTSQPTLPPSSQATVPPTTSNPSLSPITNTQLCSNLCLAPIPSNGCPKNPYDLPDCSEVPIGALCDADGECGTNQFLDNCMSYDVYQRVACDDSAAAIFATAATATTGATKAATTTTTTSSSSASSTASPTFKPTDLPTKFPTRPPSNPPSRPPSNKPTSAPTKSPTNTLTTGSPTFKPTDLPTKYPTRPPSNQPSRPPTKFPTKAPSNKPSMLVITGSSQARAQQFADTTSSSSSLSDNDSNYNEHSHAEYNDCLYYPGWNLDLTHCLKDCHQPTYMVNNPIFEFDTLDGCCSLHYQGKESCKVQTLQVLMKLLNDEENGGSGSLASVSGQVWKDANGNNWQDVNERTMGNGVPGVTVDLYECPPSSSKNDYPPNFRNTRLIKETQTSLDGSYLLQEIAPGSYYVQVTPPEGYHLSNNHPWRDDEFDSDFNGEGKSRCVDFATAGVREVTFDAGLIPDDDVLVQDVGVGGPLAETKMELVSAAAAAANDEVEQEDLRPSQDSNTSKEEHPDQQEEVGTVTYSSYYAAKHTKSRTSDSPERGNNNNNAQQLDNGMASSSSSSTAIHTKSFLRSSSYSNTGIAPSTHSTVMVPIQPTDDATIHSNEGIMFVGGTGELMVGPQSSWHNDILLKFDVTPFALTERRDYRAANKAVLRMYALTSSPSGGVVHFASSNIWDEENVTWSTAPEASHVLATIGQTRPNLWVEVDVTGMLLTDDGIATLRITSEANNHSWVAKYSSKENGEGHPAPELRVFF